MESDLQLLHCTHHISLKLKMKVMIKCFFPFYRYTQSTTGSCVTMAEGLDSAMPTGVEQRKIIESLEGKEESLHVYCVTKRWYEKWRSFAGLNSENQSKESECPGMLDMDRECDDNNMYVDEKIWHEWVAWYGIDDEHELDRRNWASDEKEFEVCILSPYSGIVENPTKMFDLSEEAGYVELQLKKIFKVPVHRGTRLWACEKTRHARFHLVPDRLFSICHQNKIDHKKDYILAIEVANLDGTWPSHIPGQPKGNFDKYKSLVTGHRAEGFWENELTGTIETVFSGISVELGETVSGIVNTMKCMSSHKEKELDELKEKVDTKIRGVDEVQKSLNKKAKELFQQEDLMKSELRKIKREKDHLEQDRKKFQEELRKMEELNRSNDTKVKLNIGGSVYMTSTLTLTKDPNSMLAAMFSGLHSLKKDDDGTYFIDRDGTHFRYILNYLRDGGLREAVLSKDSEFLGEMLTEAEYYQINSLVTLLKDRLRQRGEDVSDDEETTTSGSNHGNSGKKTPPSKRPHRKVAVIK